MMPTQRERLIQLNHVLEIGPLRVRRLLDAFGSMERLTRATPGELSQVQGIGPLLAGRIVAGFRDEAWLARELERAHRQGASIVTTDDAGYPGALRTIPDPPLALYLRGTLTASDQVAVAMVGARHASLYGLQCAEQLAYALALRGVTVVSGLARGIDGAAHRGALRAGGRTLAVLGGGLARLYPDDHAALAEEIAAHGAVVSEYPMDTEPRPHYFPRRNRLISGLSLGTVVVEAAQRSGALITADCALEQGREVFAVPGPMTAVTSQGTHHLLKQGARLVTSVDDILDELRLTPVAAPAPAPDGGTAAGPASTIQRRVLGCLRRRQPASIDLIAAQSGVPMPEVSAALLQLELQGAVEQRPGKLFVLAEREAAPAA